MINTFVNDPVYQELLAAAARRDLTAAEQARLDAWFERHPEGRADWELERQLTRSLRRLPAVPVSTNFTAQVLRQVERAAARRPAPAPRGTGWLRHLGHGWQIAAACAALALVAAIQVRQSHQQAELVRSLAAVPVTGLADVDLWRNFDPINALPDGPLPSVDQLAEALK